MYQNVEMRVITSRWGLGENEGSFKEEMVFEWALEEYRNEGERHSSKQNRGMETIHTHLQYSKAWVQLNKYNLGSEH